MENNSGGNSEKLSLIPSIAMQIILSARNRYPVPTLEPKAFFPPPFHRVLFIPFSNPVELTFAVKS